jgi:hypothetical protein
MFVKKHCQRAALITNFEMKDQKIAVEIDKHNVISIRVCDKLKLFFSQYLGKLYSRKFWKRKDKFQKLYDIGYEKIKKDFNVIKLLKTFR